MRRGRELAKVARGLLEQICEQLRLQGAQSLLGAEHLRLVLLELGRHEALASGDRLLALIVGGDELQIRVRHFEVVAEYLVVADFQRLDAGS